MMINGKAIIKKVAFLMAVLLVAMLTPHIASAEEAESIGIDTILVIDSSGSMKKDSDPERVAIEAAKKYVSTNEAEDSYIALVSFGTKVNISTGFMSTATKDARKDLYKKIESIRYNGYTDIGAALSEAQMLSEEWLGRYPKRNVVILFLSDGITETDTDSDEESAALAETAVSYFEKNGIPMYTIGLSAGQKLNRQDLEEMSHRTNGLFFTTDDAWALHDIIYEIFADSRDISLLSTLEFVPDGDYHTCRIDIPNPSILETNIEIRYGEMLDDIVLVGPDGENVDIDSDNIMNYESKTFTNIKLVRPEKGEWMLKVLGIANDDIRITSSNNFNLDAELGISPAPETVSLHTAVELTARLSTNADDIEINAETYDGLDCIVYFCNPDGSVAERVPLAYDAAKNAMYAQYDAAVVGDYTVFCRFEAEYLQRESEHFNMSFANNAPACNAKPEEQGCDIRRDAAGITIDGLLANFSDPDGCPLHIDEIKFDKNVIDVTVNGDKLTVVPLKTGSSIIEFYVADDHGEKAQTSFKFKVADRLMLFIIIGAGVLVLAAVLAIVFIILKSVKKGAWGGNLSVTVVDDNDGNPRVGTYDKDRMERFGRKKIKLSETARGAANFDDTLRAPLTRVILSPTDGGMAMAVEYPQRAIDDKGRESISVTKIEVPVNQSRDITVSHGGTDYTITLELDRESHVLMGDDAF